jgi:hypothetical protein
MHVSAGQIKRQVAALMNRTATIERVTRVAQAGGTWAEMPTTIATAAPCRIAPLTSAEIEVALRRYGEVTHAGIFDPDQEIAPQYVVTDDSSREFIVTEVVEPSIPGTFKKAIMYHRNPAP